MVSALPASTLQPDAEGLRALSLDDLLAEAAGVRDRIHGRRITWSPRVLIPLVAPCRDLCGHCGFAGAPEPGHAPYLEPEQVLTIARRGAELGGHEAFFTLDEHPGGRSAARQWLVDRGCSSTFEYLVAMCHLVLDETGLLPHACPGVLGVDELTALRAVAPSQRMMLDTLEGLAALEAAGRLRIPSTTGIRAGRGRSRADRIDVLVAVADLHRRHGHVQEVVVEDGGGDPDEHLETVALARLLLPEDVHVQAPPPDLTGDFGALLTAGLDDWGGLPSQGPELDRLRHITQERGFALAPRLSVHPEYVRRTGEWIDPGLHFAVLDRSDAEGLARDDPGAVLPHRFAARAAAGNGAEVALIGPRSTAWYAGNGSRPPLIVPTPASATGAVREVLDGVGMGQEPDEDELAVLFAARGPEVPAVCEVADELRRAAVGEVVTWVRNRLVIYAEGSRPAVLSLEGVVERVVDADRQGATEISLQGGIHPGFDGEYCLYLVQAVKAAAPAMHVHGFTAPEVLEGARRLGEDLDIYLRRLADAGLGSLAGHAVRILDDGPSANGSRRLAADEWLEVHHTAHRAGLRSNVTMMFGAVDGRRHWARHLVRTRTLQRETGGFTEFVPRPFVHMGAPLYRERRARRGPTFREALLVHAVGRIAYRGLIDNLQTSWAGLGPGGVAQVLQAGGNDVGGTGLGQRGQLDEADFRAVVEPLGRPLAQRTSLYGRVAIR